MSTELPFQSPPTRMPAESSSTEPSTIRAADQCDVLIVGGGLVGAGLALMLAGLRLRTVLVEAVPPDAAGQPSFDDRSTALSNGSRRIFEALGVWSLIEREATAIRKIHVSDRGRFGFARIDAEEQGVDALGYVVLNRVMGAALWRRLAEVVNTSRGMGNDTRAATAMSTATGSLEVICPARVTSMTLQKPGMLAGQMPGSAAIQAGWREVALDLGAQHPPRTIAARLVVAADGARSAVREAANIGSATWDYEQTAIVSNVATQKFHDHVAYERFTPEGPLALLPLSEGRMGLIWTCAKDRTAEMLALSDAEFLERLQRAFGFRLGRISRVGKRASYPLQLTRSEEHIATRLAIIGNAAQSLHPIAGQGFNLGLRDAASLAEVLADALTEALQAPSDVVERATPRNRGTALDFGIASDGSAEFDCGRATALEKYRDWRSQDRRRIIAFTDGLVRVFAQPFGPIKVLRDVGLLLFDTAPVAKNALSQLSLGAAGRVPRLARGAPL